MLQNIYKTECPIIGQAWWRWLVNNITNGNGYTKFTPWPCFFPGLGGPAEHGLHTVYISKLAKISFLICRRVAFGRHGSGKVKQKPLVLFTNGGTAYFKIFAF